MGLGSISAGRGSGTLLAVGVLLAAFTVEARAQFFNLTPISPPADVPSAAARHRLLTSDRRRRHKRRRLPRRAGRALHSLPPAANHAARIRNGRIRRHRPARALTARYGCDMQQITGGLHWRIYPVKPDQGGAFRPLKEDRGRAGRFAAPRELRRPCRLRSRVYGAGGAAPSRGHARNLRDTAGGLRIEGRVGDVRIPPGQISFDLYRGSQFEPGDRRPIVQSVASGDVILVPDGTTMSCRTTAMATRWCAPTSACRSASSSTPLSLTAPP